MRKQTRTLERKSRHRLNRLRRDLNGLATQVTEELHTGRRQLQELREERDKAAESPRKQGKRNQGANGNLDDGLEGARTAPFSTDAAPKRASAARMSEALPAGQGQAEEGQESDHQRASTK